MIKGYSEMLSGIIDLYDPDHLDRVNREVSIHNQTTETITVRCYNLNDLFEKYNMHHIDYLSLDTEGGEYEILTSIDFNTYQIDSLSVENNYGNQRFSEFLVSKGYRLVKNLGCDEIYVHNRVSLNEN